MFSHIFPASNKKREPKDQHVLAEWEDLYRSWDVHEGDEGMEDNEY